MSQRTDDDDLTTLSGLLWRNAMETPHAPAIIGEHPCTWSELKDDVARWAAALVDIGVRAGDRVALLALNRREYYITQLAIAWAGAISVPINTRLADREIAFWLEDSGASTLLLDQPFAGRGRAITAGLGTNVRLFGMESGMDDFGSLPDRARVMPPIDREDCRGSDVLGIYYTGGTTGRSKGVPVRHEALCGTASSILESSGLRGNSRYLHCAPMFHLADGILAMAATLAGSAHAFLQEFNPQLFWQVIEREQITDTILVPTMVAMLVQSPPTSSAACRSWQRLVYGGSPIASATLNGFREIHPDISFVQYYAQTEALVMTALSAADHESDSWPAIARSAGKPLEEIEMQIVDSSGLAVGTGEVGEITVRSPTAMTGYWDNEEATAAALRDGWLFTGDAGYLDEQGYLFIVDRLKDMIITGGENVFSGEVENALSSHPEVAECAVIGVPDERWGEAVHAVVVPVSGKTPEAANLIAHCRDMIAAYKCPRTIEFREAGLPKSGAGKILKAELRQPYWQDQDRQVG